MEIKERERAGQRPACSTKLGVQAAEEQRDRPAHLGDNSESAHRTLNASDRGHFRLAPILGESAQFLILHTVLAIEIWGAILNQVHSALLNS